jgi:hypothetical protein
MWSLGPRWSSARGTPARRCGDVFGFNVIAFNAAIPPTGPALEKLSADIGGHFALPRNGVVSHQNRSRRVRKHGAA